MADIILMSREFRDLFGAALSKRVPYLTRWDLDQIEARLNG